MRWDDGMEDFKVRFDPTCIGKNIQTYREKQHLTQKALGKQCGVSNNTISRIENSVKMPSIELLERIASALHVTVDHLLEGCTVADFHKQPSEELRVLLKNLSEEKQKALLCILEYLIDKYYSGGQE